MELNMRELFLLKAILTEKQKKYGHSNHILNGLLLKINKEIAEQPLYEKGDFKKEYECVFKSLKETAE